MARKTKAVKQEPQVDVGAEIFASLRELEKVKGIPVEYMVDRLKQALTNAYRRDREDHKDLPADNVVVNLDEHGLSIHLVKTAVEQENLEKKKELWQYLKAKDGGLYFRLRHGLFGRTMNLPGRGGRKLSVAAYKISQKFYGFN